MEPNKMKFDYEKAFAYVVKETQPILEVAALAAKALVVRRILAEGFGATYKSQWYINLRIKKGRPVDFVNLSMTGKMYQGWNVPESYVDGSIVGAGVKAGDSETAIKLAANKQRYPEFDLLTPIEKEIIYGGYIEKQLKKIIENAFKNKI